MTESTIPPSNKVRKQNGQFQKGYSGNIRGRPRKRAINSADDFRDAFLKLGLQKINMGMAGKSREVTLIEAALFQALTQAAKGDKAMIKFTLSHFLSSAKSFDESKLQQMEFLLDTKDIFQKKANEFRTAKDRWPDEEIEKINLLLELLDDFGGRVSRKMDGSKK
ncbi:MAG TPA: hypothetical protein DCM27_04435 [Rhodospirillaceae bacterium]|nr:hypothetical protein [Rhodospirillaceae bacterium]